MWSKSVGQDRMLRNTLKTQSRLVSVKGDKVIQWERVFQQMVLGQQGVSTYMGTSDCPQNSSAGHGLKGKNTLLEHGFGKEFLGHKKQDIHGKKLVS